MLVQHLQLCSEVHKSKRSLKRRMKMSEKWKKGGGGTSEVPEAQGLGLKKTKLNLSKMDCNEAGGGVDGEGGCIEGARAEWVF